MDPPAVVALMHTPLGAARVKLMRRRAEAAQPRLIGGLEGSRVAFRGFEWAQTSVSRPCTWQGGDVASTAVSGSRIWKK